MLVALGFESSLVGRSHECDHPESVSDLPVCTAPSIKFSQQSAEIDQQVKSALQEGLSLYHIRREELQQLQPDLILTQAQCDVCAVSLKELENAVRDDLNVDAQIFSFEPTDLGSVWQDLRQLAQRLEVPQRGDQLVFKYQQRMAAIASQALSEPPRVACLEWMDPLMAAGNWMPELLEMAGGDNLFGEVGVHSPYLEWESLSEADPEVILLMPCGYSLERTMAELPLLQKQPGWKDLSAVKTGRVYACDGQQYFNRPGPRLVESLEILAEILHPQDFDFGHRGRAWKPVCTD